MGVPAERESSLWRQTAVRHDARLKDSAAGLRWGHWRLGRAALFDPVQLPGKFARLAQAHPAPLAGSGRDAGPPLLLRQRRAVFG